MTRADLAKLLTDPDPAKFLLTDETPVTFGMLCTALEAVGSLKTDLIKRPCCPVCCFPAPGWPDYWRWSKTRGAYICGECVAKGENL
jgi:hypothetical protein